MTADTRQPQEAPLTLEQTLDLIRSGLEEGLVLDRIAGTVPIFHRAAVIDPNSQEPSKDSKDFRVTTEAGRTPQEADRDRRGWLLDLIQPIVNQADREGWDPTDPITDALLAAGVTLATPALNVERLALALKLANGGGHLELLMEENAYRAAARDILLAARAALDPAASDGAA